MARPRRTLLVLLLLAALGWTSTGLTSVASARSSAPSSIDKQFLRNTSHTDWAEITAGHLALQRSTHGLVKRLARVTRRDHKKAQAALLDVASAEGVSVPNRPNKLQVREAALLKRIPRRDFDVAYLLAQIVGHRVSINVTELELHKGTDPKVKAFAAQYLPVAQMHLRMAKRDLRVLFAK